MTLAMNTLAPPIQTRGLTKRYGELTALDNLTLEIGPGQVFGFIGPNGAGKTTTMKILSCLLEPDAGVASICGFSTATHQDEVRRRIGYMPDFLGVYDDLTVDEYLQFFASIYNIPRKNRSTIVGQVLELTDLTLKRDALVDGLSRGMQQRLGVARVLVHDPQVLFLDEPASGLDPRARIEMRSLLVELGRMGKTLMVSSHILSELAEMSTSIGIIERGKLLYAGSIEDAYARTKAAANISERISIKLEEGSIPASMLAPRLSADARVANAKPDDAARTLSVDLAQGEHGHHFLLESIMNAGGRIAGFTPEPIRLEDAFLKLTTGALQ
jgi:ABC-2 type transport system ATP-binding protein